jgi:hypothetical protein
MRNTQPSELNLLYNGWKQYQASRVVDIIKMREGNPPATYQAIGDKWGMSRQRAQQIYLAAKRQPEPVKEQ